MAKKKGLFLVFTVLGLSAVLFSQCTGSNDKLAVPDASGAGLPYAGSNQGDNRKPNVTVKVAVMAEPEAYEELKAQSARIQESAGISVRIERLPGKEAYAELKKRSQLGKAPDIMLLDSAWVNEFAALGFLLPVDELFTTEQQTQRIPAAMNQVKWNGYVWGVPSGVDPYVLVWSKLAAAELKTANGPQTAAELIAWNKAAMRPDDGRYGIVFDPSDIYAFLSLACSFGGSWPAFDNRTAALSDAAALKGLSSFLVPQQDTWSDTWLLKNVPDRFEPDAVWKSLAEGRTAGLVTTLSDYRRHADSAVDFVPLPASGDKASGWMRAFSYAISSHTTVPEAALLWVRAMTEEGLLTQYYGKAGVLPPILSSYEQPPIRSDDLTGVYVPLVVRGRVPHVSVDGAAEEKLLQRSLQQLWQGETDLKTFAERLDGQFGK